MALDALRERLHAADVRAVAVWRKIEVRKVLRDTSMSYEQRGVIEDALGRSVALPVGELLAAYSLRTFSPPLLASLEAVFGKHFDAWLRTEGERAQLRDPLVERVVAAGLADRLRDHANCLGQGGVVGDARQFYGYDLVGELAIAELTPGPLSQRLNRAKAVAREYLERCIARAKESASREAEHASVAARAPAPELAKLDAQLEAFGDRLESAPRARGTFVPGSTRFVEPGAFVYREDGDGVTTDLVAIDVSGDAPRIEKRRARNADLPAIAPYAIAAARRQLRTPGSDGWDALVRFAGTASWSRTLAAIEQVLAAHRGGQRAFVLVRKKTSIEVRTYEVERDATGAEKLVSSPHHYGERARDPDDARVLRVLDRIHTNQGHSVEDKLVGLLGHPRVHVHPSLERVRVERDTVVLRARAEGGAVRLELALGPTALDRANVYGAGCAVVFGPGLVRFGVLDDTQQALLVALSSFGAVLPAEARATLLPKLERLAGKIEVELQGDLVGAEVAPDPQLVVRLDARQWPDVTLAIRVRPLAGAAPCVPGEGPLQARGVVDGQAVFATRDRGAERAKAEALATDLGIERDHREVTLRPLDRALATLASLRARDDVTIAWTGKPIEVRRALTRRDLRVEVAQRGGWFTIGADVEVDERHLGLAILLEAARSDRRYVVLAPGKLVELEADLRSRLEALADHVSARVDGALEIGLAAAPAIAALAPDAVAPAFARVLERLEAATSREPRVPTHLAKVLRPYQREGFAWLARLASWGAGGVLADDMGLGKTLQAIALLHARGAEGPALVVAPTSVVGNWHAELARFGKGLRAIDYREGRATALGKLRAKDVLVASYDLVSRDAASFEGVRFATMIVDEAQAVKNASTQRARALRAIEREVCFALTGTPIENHLGELWSIAEIACPGLLGPWDVFRARFAEPIERANDPAARASLARLMRPFLLRRTKDAVAPELPARTEVTRTVELGPEERAGYEAARRSALAKLAGMGDDPRDRFRALAELMQLRRLACHPRLVDPESALPSAKLEATMELVDEIVEGGHRALVFSQFVDHLAVVRRELDARGVRYLYLDGSTDPRERPRLVAAFQSGDAPLFLISLRAGGTGLNLTAADTVLHLDPWWNPAVEDQATDRAHRIGQTRPVTVVRLVAAQTIEEAVISLHERKRALADALLEGADTAARLSMRELVALVRGS